MKAAVLALVVFAPVAVSSVSAATPRSFYWTVAHANTAAKTFVKVPFCRVYPTSKNCANGTGSPIPVMAATCVGAGGAVNGRFRQFACKVTLLNDLGTARVTVYTAGPTALRWKTVCVPSAEVC